MICEKCENDSEIFCEMCKFGMKCRDTEGDRSRFIDMFHEEISFDTSLKSKKEIIEKISFCESLLIYGYKIIGPPRGKHKCDLKGFIRGLKWTLEKGENNIE